MNDADYMTQCQNNNIHQYTPDQIDKIGNTVIYIADRIKPLYKTKLLKLLYFLDEFSVKKYGIPFLNLDYEVWQAGPVCSDIYQEVNEAPNMLADYIELANDNIGTKVFGRKPFCDDEFSKNEIELMDYLISTFKYSSAQELVDFTHRTSSPWYKAAHHYGLIELFESKRANTSNYRIDLVSLYPETLLRRSFTTIFRNIIKL
ncbi:type II toxin-antitoxin system antitoxin SocA domain-containing protein [Chitinophaga rhizophila]|uniref:SocA family protein n=1 Tax=Chitinophaga rhizophila TaxID=2866212 RepID=A0ABS7GKX0_9BACT|nr:Panacea domain-containing protein [Chitinophaga rhizophila]MBW8688357.1 SocA family protein [Chitinophaga rhizophila]